MKHSCVMVRFTSEQFWTPQGRGDKEAHPLHALI